MAISERVQTLRTHGYSLQTAKRIEAGEDLQRRIADAGHIEDIKSILHDLVHDAYPKADPRFMKARAGMTGADR